MLQRYLNTEQKRLVIFNKNYPAAGTSTVVSELCVQGNLFYFDITSLLLLYFEVVRVRTWFEMEPPYGFPDLYAGHLLAVKMHEQL